LVRLCERIQLHALVEQGSRDGGEVVAKGFPARGVEVALATPQV
jgi:hypothetical protein